MREIDYFKSLRQLKNKLIALIYEIVTKGFVVGFVLGILITYHETPTKIPSFSTNILAFGNRIKGLHQPSTETLADVRAMLIKVAFFFSSILPKTVTTYLKLEGTVKP